MIVKTGVNNHDNDIFYFIIKFREQYLKLYTFKGKNSTTIAIARCMTSNVATFIENEGLLCYQFFKYVSSSAQQKSNHVIGAKRFDKLAGKLHFLSPLG